LEMPLQRIEAYVVRILLVDDNALIRSYLRETLEQESEWVVVGEASNGVDAVKTCHQLKPDVAVMDFLMPKMDGLEASRQLRRQEPDVPILMVTVDPTRQLESEARKAGVRGLCPKAQIRSLVDAVRTMLKGRTNFPGLRAAA